jgi:hypothetical protein
MWAALLAGALSVMRQTQTEISQTRGTDRMSRVRPELLALRGRVISHASQTTLPLPTGHKLLPHVPAKIRALPPPALNPRTASRTPTNQGHSEPRPPGTPSGKPACHHHARPAKPLTINPFHRSGHQDQLLPEDLGQLIPMG